MGISVDRIDHVVINCRDVAATADWYRRVLGMAVEKFGATARTALRFGNQKINLRPIGALDVDPTWLTATTEVAGSQDLCFITASSSDDVRAHLISCDVDITNGPVAKLGAMGDMVSQYCHDLDGNLIEIAVYV